MAILSAKTGETAKPMPGRDQLLGDGDGLFLRIRPNGNKPAPVRPSKPKPLVRKPAPKQ